MALDNAARRRLQGIQDARSTRGIMSRGKNVYSAGVSAPNNQAGKPLSFTNSQRAAAKRVRKNK